jgi:hypothetical protein
MWRNVRIPKLSLLPGYDRANPEKWIDVPEEEIVNHASLIGIPVAGRPKAFLGAI